MEKVNAAREPLWGWLQQVGLGATGLLLVGLVVWPKVSLTLLWSVVIPLVPASLLIAPQLWRNVCPLATINMASNGRWARRAPSQRALAAAGVLGVVLLWGMVSARRFLFNTDGLALAITIAVVAVLAMVLGGFFEAKAGFCNALCPVLPVERLYGQSPFVEFGNPRCESCAHCSVKGCIDLAPAKSIAPMVGPAPGGRPWWLTTFGIFAAAFPGFVLGYYLTSDGPLSTASAVCLRILTWMGVSYLTTVLVGGLFRVSAARAMPVLAAAGAGFYYWFASPVLGAVIDLSGGGITALRILFLGLVGMWFLRSQLTLIRINARA